MDNFPAIIPEGSGPGFPLETGDSLAGSLINGIASNPNRADVRLKDGRVARYELRSTDRFYWELTARI